MITINYTVFEDGLGIRIWSKAYASVKAAETVLELNRFERLGQDSVYKWCWSKEFENRYVIAYVNKPTDQY